MVFVKDHRDDYEEYAGSTDDEDYSVPRWITTDNFGYGETGGDWQ